MGLSSPVSSFPGEEPLRREALRVFVRGLEIEAGIGVYDHEHGRLQRLVIDVMLELEPNAIERLGDTVNYETVAEAARASKLKPDEMGGGTITVTSLGPLGGIATTPVINRPEVAIIGPNRIVERPVFRPNGQGGDDIVRAKLMNLSISCDHRVVDGWDAASYVQALKKLLETPVLLFAD